MVPSLFLHFFASYPESAKESPRTRSMPRPNTLFESRVAYGDSLSPLVPTHSRNSPAPEQRPDLDFRAYDDGDSLSHQSADGIESDYPLQAPSGRHMRDGREALPVALAEEGILDEGHGRNQEPIEKRFEAIEVPDGYKPLTFLPKMLKPGVTITLAIFNICVLGGVIALHYIAKTHRRNEVNEVNTYFAAKFGPALLATISITLLKAVWSDFLRLLPYINMSDSGGNQSGIFTISAVYWPVIFTHNTSRILFLEAFWALQTFMIANAKGLILQVIPEDSHWVVVIHGGVAIVLVAWLVATTSWLVWLTYWLWSRNTGLREDWDPQCLADILALFAWCDFNPHALNFDTEQAIYGFLRKEASRKSFRIGYWNRITPAGTDIVYGIRALGDVPPRRLAREPKAYFSKSTARGYPYLFTPTPLTLTWLGIWFFVAVAMMAFLAVVFCSGFVTHGFIMDSKWHMVRLDHFNGTILETKTNVTLTGQYSWIAFDGSPERRQLLLAGFLLRSLPTNAISLSLSYLTTVDAYHRFVQPFYNMSRGPVSAADSICLDYSTSSSLAAIPEAFKRSDWKVLWFAILSTVQPFAAVLPWGVLSLTSTGTYIVAEFSEYIFWLTISFLAIFCVSCVLAWPQEKRKIPRRMIGLLDLWTMCSASRLAQNEEFKRAQSREDLMATIQLRHDKYLLGVLKCEDGIERLGVDVYYDGETQKETGYVKWVKPRSFFQSKKGYAAVETTEMQMLPAHRGSFVLSNSPSQHGGAAGPLDLLYLGDLTLNTFATLTRGNIVKSFDLQDFYWGFGTDTGTTFGLAQAGTLYVVGYTVSGQELTTTFSDVPDSTFNAHLTFAKLPAGWVNLQNVTFAVAQSEPISERTYIALDNVRHINHV